LAVIVEARYQAVRQLTPFDPKVIGNQFTLLNNIYFQSESEYIKKDHYYFQGVAAIFNILYKSRFPNIFKTLQTPYNHSIASIVSSFDGHESKHTHKIKTIFDGIFCAISEEKRGIISEELIPYLPDLWERVKELIEQKKDKKED